VKECTIKKFILEDLSPTAVNSAIEDNIYNLFILIGKKGKRKFYIDSKIKWIMAAPSVWPNYLFDARFEEPEESIEYIKKKVRFGKAPSQWFLGPRSHTKGLVKALTKGGFTLSPLYLNIETEALEKPLHLPLCLRQKKWASKSGAFLPHSSERWFTGGLDLKNSVTLISIIIKNIFPFEINEKRIINRK
jgi:hypothetical protein